MESINETRRTLIKSALLLSVMPLEILIHPKITLKPVILQTSADNWLITAANGAQFYTNKNGYFILNSLLEFKEASEIVENLAINYNLSISSAAEDFVNFAGLLYEKKIIS